jgi:4-hydroxybenzoate polyprenyltransferase
MPYLRLMRWHRPIGIFLLLWPTLWALWFAANGTPSAKLLMVFIAGVCVMRSAGCVINDFADRHFDAHVARTRERPLATGEIQPRAAIILFIAVCFIALILAAQLNAFTIKLSAIGLLLAIIYPFTKRITYWPQAVLGAAYGWSIPMAFAAVLNTVPAYAWLLYSAALFWTMAYDTLYAMVDRADDKKIGIKSTALLFGAYDRFWIGTLQLMVLVLLSYIGWLLRLKIMYFCSLLAALGLVIYQQYLIKNREPAQCFQAFLNNNWLGMVIFLGVFLSYC